MSRILPRLSEESYSADPDVWLLQGPALPADAAAMIAQAAALLEHDGWSLNLGEALRYAHQLRVHLRENATARQAGQPACVHHWSTCPFVNAAADTLRVHDQHDAL